MKFTCLHCGKEFESYTRNRKFCSPACSNKHGVHRKKIKGIIQICEYCGKEFYVEPNLILKNRGYFCSFECKNNARVKKNEYIFGENEIQIVLKSKKYGIKYALIDKADYEKIKDYTWTLNAKHYPNFYVCAWNRKLKKRMQLHRIITDCPKNLVVDHINHNPLDNRKINLRVCTQYENMQNQSKKKFKK